MRINGDDQPDRIVVALVGPCASGKTTLRATLQEAGFHVRMPAQEHSYVTDMWQKITNPDVLIYLDVQYEAVQARRRITWGPEWLEAQKKRLRHAQQHADLYIDTTNLAISDVTQHVIAFLENWLK